MLRAAKRMTGYKIVAVDGNIGHSSDWYFDARSWAVRYLEVDAGGWLSGRLVLLSPAVLGDVNEDNKTIEVGLSSEQVRNSPPREAVETVSRRYEMELQRHFGWPAYWVEAGAFAEPGMIPPMMPEAPAAGGAARAPSQDAQELHAAKEVAGYPIQAIDGTIGHLEDLVIDDEDWLVRYLLVDTKPWRTGGHVIVAAEWSRFRWEERAVAVDLTRNAVRRSPPFDPSKPVNREYERKLYEYYGRGTGDGGRGTG